MPEASQPLLNIENLGFGWPDEPDFLTIDTFSLGRSERVFLEGPSGSGKSTLLGLITGVLSPRTGSIRFSEAELTALSAGRRDKLRADRIGVIFQLFNLLPYLSVLDNVLLSCRFSEMRRKKANEKPGGAEAEAKRLLARLGLTDQSLISKKAGNLSVGQQQRVAAARALIGAPELIIADEPTSALDTATRNAFIELLLEEADATGSALLFVSHDATLAQSFGRRVSLNDLNSARSRVAA